MGYFLRSKKTDLCNAGERVFSIYEGRLYYNRFSFNHKVKQK